MWKTDFSIPRICTFLILPFVLHAQGKNSFVQMAKKHMYPFSFDTSFHGDGWEKIITAAENHKYFLLGEDHGAAEIAMFSEELAKRVRFDLFVTEIDSVTACITKELAAKTSTELDSFTTNHPSALSFYSAQEEFQLIRELTKSNADIWGLDQVSLFSTGIVFKRLSELCTSKEAKALTLKFAERSDQLFDEATRTGDYNRLFVYSAKKEVFDALWEAIKTESKEAQNILNEIEASWRIYNGIDNADYYTRTGRMKSKLLNYYIDASIKGKRYGKVLYKFGAYHISRGLSIVGGYDIGNFVSNIADAEETSSYHLMVIGKEGEMNSFLLAEGMKSNPFDIANKASQLNALLPLAHLIKEREWVFFDLKPMRKLLGKGDLKIESAFLKKTIAGYDGLVILPKVTPSTIMYKK